MHLCEKYVIIFLSVMSRFYAESKENLIVHNGGDSMTDKVNTVKNPLTIIAIFAGLAEVSGTIVLAALGIQLQAIFIWFVILFPSALVILFFITLNFNPKVLYSPGDFKDENNFITTMYPNISEHSINKIEVNKENVQVYKGINEILNTTLQNGKSKFSSIDNEEFRDKQLIAKANEFFKFFMKQIEQSDIRSKFDNFSFGMHSDDMYLLSVKIKQEENETDRLSRQHDFIIHALRNEENEVALELIGWRNKIISNELAFTQPHELAKGISDYLANVIEKINSIKRKNEENNLL